MKSREFDLMIVMVSFQLEIIFVSKCSCCAACFKALSCKAKAVLGLQGVLEKLWTGLVIHKTSSSSS